MRKLTRRKRKILTAKRIKLEWLDCFADAHLRFHDEMRELAIRSRRELLKAMFGGV